MADAARLGDPCRETVSGAPLKIEDGGVPSVLIGDLPAAVVGTQVTAGSAIVLVGDKPLVRVGDLTITGGAIATGCSSVEVADDDVQATSTDEFNDLSLDLLALALDLAGIVDPTPICDGSAAFLALSRGEFLDAAISATSIVPYIGDLAKAGKLPRYLKALERAVDWADRTGQAARLLPAVQRLEQALAALPRGRNSQLDHMYSLCVNFINRHGKRVKARLVRDISQTFRFEDLGIVVFRNKTLKVRSASGRLGRPGTVKQHGIPNSVRKQVSAGTGDDAGHLIANKYGAPGSVENLSRQNWIQNQGGGTWYEMEKRWDELLESGVGVEVRIKEFTPLDADRPLYRTVEWDEIQPDGSVISHQNEPIYLNSESADFAHRKGTRTQRGDVKADHEPAEVIDLDAARKRLRPDPPDFQ